MWPEKIEDSNKKPQILESRRERNLLLDVC